MDKSIYFIIGIIIAFIITGSSVLFADTFYEMKVQNCEDILDSEYQVSTGSVSSCIKFNNFPFVDYWLPYIIGTIGLIFLSLLGIIFTLVLINDDFI